jgi:hypothetical protein
MAQFFILSCRLCTLLKNQVPEVLIVGKVKYPPLFGTSAI